MAPVAREERDVDLSQGAAGATANVPASTAGTRAGGDPEPAQPTESMQPVEPPPPPVDVRSIAAEPADEAAHVFDPAVLHTFDVEIAPADLQSVDANPAAEQYVAARLRFEGKTYDAGYRYKGSLGAFFPPCTDFLTSAKQGKCSIKLSFNWVNPDGRFFGLKKLLFHAMNNDPSHLRERLGYALFREMGVPAPRASHAVLRVNGKADVYALVEEVDSRFTRSRFAEGGKGNLYKEIWPVHDEPQAYIDALETNDKEPNVERMQKFRQAIESGPDAMAAWMDVDVTTSYMAVDRVILNDDGAFHFYCFERAIGNNPKAPGNHNYYWYEAEQADRMWIIPWDLDMAMNDKLEPPHIEVDWRAPPDAAQCNVCASSALGAGSPAPSCDRVIRGFQAWRAMYETKIDRFVAGPFSKSAVDEKLQRWQQQLAAAGYAVPADAFQQLTQVLDRARQNRGYRY